MDPDPRSWGKRRWGIHRPEGSGRACWRTQNEPRPRRSWDLWRRWAEVLCRGEKSRNPGAIKRAPRPVVIRAAEASPPRMGNFFPAPAHTLPPMHACASLLESSGCHEPHSTCLSASPTGLKSLSESPIEHSCSVPGVRRWPQSLGDFSPGSRQSHDFRVARRERMGPLAKEGPFG